MKPHTATYTLSGSVEALTLPDQIHYLQIYNRGSNSWKIGFDSSGTNYLEMDESDYYEWPYDPGRPLKYAVYVDGTTSDVLEYEYWV